MLRETEKQVIDLLGQKVKQIEIARQLDLTPGQVSGVAYRLRHNHLRRRRHISVAPVANAPCKFLYKDARSAARMLRSHSSFDEIVQVFAGKYTHAGIQYLIAEYRKRNREAVRKHDENAKLCATPRIYVPPETERRWQDRAMLRPRTITALICGDPLPGESALDRRPVESLEKKTDFVARTGFTNVDGTHDRNSTPVPAFG